MVFSEITLDRPPALRYNTHMSFVSNIHNVEAVKVEGIRRTDGTRGWITLKFESVSEYTGPEGEVEITLFANDIAKLRSLIIEQLDQEMSTYA